MASRVTAFVLVGLLVVAGGCTGTDSSSPTTSVSPIETQTPTPAKPSTSTQAGSDVTTSATNATVAGISIQKENGSDAVVVKIRANTSLESTDPEGDNPGEPYFQIKVDGETVLETQEVTRSTLGEYTVELDSSDFRQADSRDVSVTVVLMDSDSVFDDEIRSWSTSVEVPRSSTTSSQRATTPRPTSTTDQMSTTTTRTTRTTKTTTPTATTTTSATATTKTTETTNTGSGQASYTVTLVEVIDGDTARVEYQNGSTAKVRFLGVDTPEVHTDNDPGEFENVPNTEAGTNCLRDWGHKASEFTRSKLRGEQVTITFDENEPRRGSYGRLLVYVHHDGELFNYQLVDQGYARMYDSDFTKRSRFASAESNAQQESIGLWDCTDAQSTTTESTTTESSSSGEGSLSVVQVHADASGNDHENENGEYIVFKNTGDGTLDLSGWVLKDDADHTYYFPDGFTLPPGETVTVYTGSGTNTDSEVYWGSDSAVWNNGGDTIIVTNANGDVVIRREYSG